MAELIFPLQFKRQFADSLDPDMVFDTVSDMNAYLTNPLRYAGQIVACTETESAINILNNAKNAWISINNIYAPITGSANYIQNQNVAPQPATIWINGAMTGLSFIKTGGVSTQFLKADGSVDSNTYLIGNQNISLSGEASGNGTTAINVTLLESAVTGKLLTGLNTIGGGSIAATDSILIAFGKVQNQITSLLGGVTFQTTWNAATNSPTITNSVGTKGWYYVVNVPGSTSIDGISDWKVGDWIIYDGTKWKKVDNTDAVSSVNGFTGAVSLTSDNITEGATNKYYLDSRARASLSSGTGINYVSSTGVINCTITQYTDAAARAAISLTTTGNSGAGTYTQATGVFNIPNYTLSGLNGEVAGTAAGIMATHNSTYNHANIANGQTAYGWGNHAGLYLLLTGGHVTGNVLITGPSGWNTALNIESTGVGIDCTSIGDNAYGIVGASNGVPMEARSLLTAATGSRLTLNLGCDPAHTTPAVGFGLGMSWIMPYLGWTNPQLAGKEGGSYSCFWTDVTANAETSKYTWSLRSSGVLADRMILEGNGNLSTTGSGTFAGGGFNSLRSMKNINDDWNGSAMDVISNFKLRDFNYKTRPNSDRTLGFIIDEVPKNISEYFLMGKNKDAINQYTMIGISYKAHQEEKIELDIIKKRIESLELIINK